MMQQMQKPASGFNGRIMPCCQKEMGLQQLISQKK